MRTRRLLCFTLSLGLLLGASALGAGSASAATAGGLRFAVNLGSRDVTLSTGAHPIRLDPKETILMGLTATNTTSRDVLITAVRLEGEVGGLTFFSYQVALDMPIAAGATEARKVTVNLDGLEKQATGLMAGRVQLLTTHNKVLASAAMVTDVRGSSLATYALCGLAVALFSLLGFLSALLALMQHKLPLNRFARAARFGFPALGAGLFVVFLLSAFRVTVPRTTSGVPVVLLAGAVGFVVGYLTPTPEDPAWYYQDDYEDNYGEDIQLAEPPHEAGQHAGSAGP